MNQISNMKVSIGVVIALVLQLSGGIWIVSQKDAQLNNLTVEMQEVKEMLVNEDLWETVSELSDIIDELEDRVMIINNETRTILSDHKLFGQRLQALQSENILPSGEMRDYGYD